MGSSKPREVDLEGNSQESGSPWQLNRSQGNRREEMPVEEETGKRLSSSSVSNPAEVKVQSRGHLCPERAHKAGIITDWEEPRGRGAGASPPDLS